MKKTALTLALALASLPLAYSQTGSGQTGSTQSEEQKDQKDQKDTKKTKKKKGDAEKDKKGDADRTEKETPPPATPPR